MFHTFAVDSARFDDDNLVSVAGLVPVLTLAETYEAWLSFARAAIEPGAQDAVFGGNASRIYRL